MPGLTVSQEDAASNEGRGARRDADGDLVLDSQDESHDQSEQDDDDDDEMDEAARIRKRQQREAAKKKALRQKYRTLQTEVDNIRGDLANTSVAALKDQVTKANHLFSKVETPAEAVLDSRVLIATSEAGALKARQLKIDADAFDIDEFLVRLGHFMSGSVAANGRAQARRAFRANRGSDDEGPAGGMPWAWGRVGKVLLGESRRPAILEHMYGPLQLEIKEKKQRTQRQRQKIDESQRMRPEELHAEDVAKNENETGKVTARIAKHLQTVAGTRGIPYLKFIVNPDSFSQTVENMFYFSFLVREQKVALEVDDDEESPFYGDMIAYVVDQESAAQVVKDSNVVKHQVVLELTQEVWQEAIEVYDITEPMIATRDAFVPPTQNGKIKWG
ncbi:hypothetical protein JCM10212_006108 [Sporobolomyces blumeae]